MGLGDYFVDFYMTTVLDLNFLGDRIERRISKYVSYISWPKKINKKLEASHKTTWATSFRNWIKEERQKAGEMIIKNNK